MTPEELLEINPKLGKMAVFMKEHPEYTVRFWDDATVDITLPKDAGLWKFVGGFRCPSCMEITEGPAMEPGKANITGTFRSCEECGIRFFIHTSVKFGGSPA